jgi:hypothetical protein
MLLPELGGSSWSLSVNGGRGALVLDFFFFFLLGCFFCKSGGLIDKGLTYQCLQIVD